VDITIPGYVVTRAAAAVLGAAAAVGVLVLLSRWAREKGGEQ